MTQPAVEPRRLAEDGVEQQRDQGREAEQGRGCEAAYPEVEYPQCEHVRSMGGGAIAVNGAAWFSPPSGRRQRLYLGGRRGAEA